MLIGIGRRQFVTALGLSLPAVSSMMRRYQVHRVLLRPLAQLYPV
jgi:hypothetical protein